ncbi:MAG: pentapeptide repeat-containing protein, partial [Flammeovirgaceae bacterium]
VIRLFELALLRHMPIPDISGPGSVFRMLGNAEEAFFVIIDALGRCSQRAGCNPQDLGAEIQWPGSSGDGENSELREMMNRIRSRPGSPDSMLMSHLNGVFLLSGEGIRNQLNTKFARRPDGYDYAVSMDFSGARFEGISFFKADLAYARFHRAQLSNCDLSDCGLSGVDLTYGSMLDCNLQDALVDGMVLEGVDLSPARPVRKNRSVRANSLNEKDIKRWFVDQGSIVDRSVSIERRHERDANRDR